MFVDSSELIITANHFRKWVCDELAALGIDERKPLRGDYVFVIDGEPRFVVFVEDNWCGSLIVERDGQVCFDENVSLRFNASEFDNLVNSAFRVKVSTDANTLKKLLYGNIKARVAYLSGLVTVEGDLPIFLGLVGKLKSRGVRPFPLLNRTADKSHVTFS